MPLDECNNYKTRLSDWDLLYNANLTEFYPFGIHYISFSSIGFQYSSDWLLSIETNLYFPSTSTDPIWLNIEMHGFSSITNTIDGPIRPLMFSVPLFTTTNLSKLVFMSFPYSVSFQMVINSQRFISVKYIYQTLISSHNPFSNIDNQRIMDWNSILNVDKIWLSLLIIVHLIIPWMRYSEIHIMNGNLFELMIIGKLAPIQQSMIPKIL